jgi:phage-related tail fiber protein
MFLMPGSRAGLHTRAAVEKVIAQYLNTVGQIEWWSTHIVKAGRLKCNGATYQRVQYPALFNYLVSASVITITIASPGVVTWNNHGLSANDPVKFFTTGSLPSGLTAGTHGLVTAGTVYYVVASSITADTFEVSTTPGGSAVNTSGSQSGTQTAVVAPWGDGDGAATFTVPDLRGTFPRAWDDGAGIDSNRSFGAKQTDAFQGHFHTVTGGQIVNAGGSGSQDFSSGVRQTPSVSVTGAITDGTNGTPRTAAETRPVNYALMPTIRYL